MNSRIARKYAKAFFDSIKKENFQAAEILETSNQISEIFGNPRVLGVFKSPIVPDETKRAIIAEIVKCMKFSQNFARFCQGVAAANRAEFLNQIMVELRVLLAKAAGLLEVKLISASELSANQEENIKDMITKMTGSTVFLSKTVEPSIIGGVILSVGNNRLDLSLKKKISEFARTAIS